MGVRHYAYSWTAVGSSLLHSPADIRYLPAWLGSMRQPRSSGPLARGIPYMPFSLVQELEHRITPESRVFEYGSGGSTLWLSSRAGWVTSVEHHPQWHSLVARELARAGIKNCTLLLRQPLKPGDGPTPARFCSTLVGGNFKEYVTAIDTVEDESLDLVIVDGRARDACALQARDKLRPGGVLILDDSDRERYAGAVAELAAWPRRDFWGIKPFTVPPARSSWWVKPAAA